MTTIQRLGIVGIRSYGPDTEQVITFTPPLTLIVGANGCGKTTVIESLRMATCGVLPPNSGSGQAFVHDPRVSHQKSAETKGKIRLRFHDCAGTRHTVSRLFNLSNKRVNKVEKQQYKQLEGSIETRNRDGTKSAITNKCAEIDKLIPEFMGVSQAVLQNVIFCHQEESNWILGEPKVLKDKFDAIFASTRYSKALEQVKKTQAELKITLKDFEKDEAQQKEIKRHAYEFKQNLRKRQAESEDTKKKKLELQGSIKKEQEQLDRCHQGLRRYTEYDEFRKESKQKIETWKQEEGKLSSRMKEVLKESDDELRKAKRDLEKLIQDNESAKRKHRDEVEKSKEAIDECKENLSTLESKYSKLQATQEMVREEEGERSKLANSIADTYAMDKGLVPVPFERAPSTFCRELQNKFEAKKKDAETRKRSNKRALEATQEEFGKVTQEHDREQQAIEHTKKLIVDKRSELAHVERSIQELDYDHEELPKLEEKKEKLKRAMADLPRSPDKIQEEIDGKRLPLQRATEKRDKLKTEMKARQADKEKIAFVKRDKEELEKLKKDLQEKMDGHHALEELLNYKPKLDEVAAVTDTVKQELAAGKAELDDAKEEHLRAKTEAGRIDSLLQSNTEERERLNKRMRDLIAEAKEIRAGGAEVKGLVEAVDGAPGAASFDDLITGLEKKKEKKQTSAAFAGSMKQVVDLFEQHQAKDHNCPLCARDISPGSNELKIFQEKLSEFLQDIDSADAKRKIEGFDKQIVALREARDKKDHAGKVQAQAQELAGQEDDMKQERERAARQLEDAADKQTRAQERYDKTEHVSDFLRQLDLANLNRLRQKIAQAEAELSSRDPNERDILDLEQEHNDADKQVTDLRSEIEAMTNEKSAIFDELQKRKKLYDDAKDKVAACERKKESHDEKAKRQADIKRDVEKLEQENRIRQLKLPELETKKEESKAKIGRQQKEFEGQDRQNDLDINDMWKVLSQLQGFEKKIADYKQQRLDKEEQKLKGRIDEEKARLQGAEAKFKAAKERAGDNGNSAANEQMVREIEDNLAWRDYRNKIKELEEEMQDRLDELHSLPTKKELRELADKLDQDVRDKNNQVQQKEGQLLSLSQQIKDLEKKLKEKDYVDIDKRYRKTQIGIETNKGASKDLDKYYAALDKALMRFHEMKMEEINKYVKEYWQTTYKGDDIETIEIKADLENQANRRSHNYRLVMRHRHMSELDMRGRCSAGQKVLASLVVRLALAETFCHNCGVLALDEPTSNLDERNIQGFTEALGRIVNDRKQAKNNGFQLIVISHDNEFIDNLARLTDVPAYFRLSKDQETQYSMISCHDVQEFG